MVADLSLRETGEDVMRVVVSLLYVLCVKHNNELQLQLLLQIVPSFLLANHVATVIKGFDGVRKIFFCD